MTVDVAINGKVGVYQYTSITVYQYTSIPVFVHNYIPAGAVIPVYR